mmetsp:Transcript_36583/g.74667  ORF Transcript_36583/g.74667 Transcript_36583/m.74667 type:complete len:154 (+) Transcript_36583:2442-2903(+)
MRGSKESVAETNSFTASLFIGVRRIMVVLIPKVSTEASILVRGCVSFIGHEEESVISDSGAGRHQKLIKKRSRRWVHPLRVVKKKNHSLAMAYRHNFHKLTEQISKSLLCIHSIIIAAIILLRKILTPQNTGKIWHDSSESPDLFPYVPFQGR